MIKHISIYFILLISVSVNAQKYVEVWADEFNTRGLPDSTKWSYEVGQIRNNELPYFTCKRLENARIEDSVLILETRKEQYEGAEYTSASIISKGTGDWKYGKIEIRAKVPGGKGTWPALWMMPTYREYGSWPRSGEIDIMEYIGVEPQNLWYTVHFKGTGSAGHESAGSGPVNAIENPYDKFITFSLIWTPEKLEWYADGVKYHEYVKPAGDYRVWPFDKKFYLLLTMTYGGTWGGYDGVDDSLLPHKFLIDYVRVYQLQDTESPFLLTVEQAAGGMVDIEPEMDYYPENTEITLTAKPDSGYVFKAWQNMSRANPYTFTIRKNTTVSPLFRKKNEILTNGTFDKNYYPWSFYVFDDSRISYSPEVVDGKLVVDIEKTTGTSWHLGFQENNMSLIKGRYKLTFDAFADKQGSLLITVAKNYPDWGAYINRGVTVGTVSKKFELTLDMPVDDENIRLFFGTGSFIGKFTIDNISLTRIIPTENNRVTELNFAYGFKIFPNPNSGEFTIKFTNSGVPGNSVLKIYNSSGNLVRLYRDIKNENRIDMRNVCTGVYYIQLITGTGFLTKRIIIN